MRRVDRIKLNFTAAAANVPFTLLSCSIENLLDVGRRIQSKVRVHTYVDRFDPYVAWDILPVFFFGVSSLFPAQLEHSPGEAIVLKDQASQSLNQVFLHLLQESPLDHRAVEPDARTIQDVHELLDLRNGVVAEFFDFFGRLVADTLAVRVDIVVEKLVELGANSD
jgi:hypothetical protein